MGPTGLRETCAARVHICGYIIHVMIIMCLHDVVMVLLLLLRVRCREARSLVIIFVPFLQILMLCILSRCCVDAFARCLSEF